jgi:hypothetical protein
MPGDGGDGAGVRCGHEGGRITCRYPARIYTKVEALPSGAICLSYTLVYTTFICYCFLLGIT